MVVRICLARLCVDVDHPAARLQRLQAISVMVKGDAASNRALDLQLDALCVQEIVVHAGGSLKKVVSGEVERFGLARLEFPHVKGDPDTIGSSINQVLLRHLLLCYPSHSLI